MIADHGFIKIINDKHRSHQITGNKINRKNNHVKNGEDNDPVKPSTVKRLPALGQNNLKQNLPYSSRNAVAAQKRNKKPAGSIKILL